MPADPRYDITPADENLSLLFPEQEFSPFHDEIHRLHSDLERTQDAASATTGSSDATSGSSDSTLFVPPIPGTSDAAAPSTSTKPSRDSGKPIDYLDVDASKLYLNKPKPTSENRKHVSIDELRQLMRNGQEPKPDAAETVNICGLGANSQALTAGKRSLEYVPLDKRSLADVLRLLR
ncbi:MAG: hypothetical protein K2X93_25615 [Candidatus Obscuribacterales bacterium]|nr:hypothetical protein [Candidatus Obscuribacterales bacterium]